MICRTCGDTGQFGYGECPDCNCGLIVEELLAVEETVEGLEQDNRDLRSKIYELEERIVVLDTERGTFLNNLVVADLHPQSNSGQERSEIGSQTPEVGATSDSPCSSRSYRDSFMRH